MRRCSLLASSVAACLSLGALSATTTAVRADSTVVTERTVSGVTKDVAATLGQGLQKPITLEVSYIKGDLSRVDSDDSIVLRGINGSGTITVLDPATRTYYVTTEAEELSRKSSHDVKANDLPIAPDMSIKSSVHSLNKERTIAGLKASGEQSEMSYTFKLPGLGKAEASSLQVVVDEENWLSSKVPQIPSSLSMEDFKLATEPILGASLFSAFIDATSKGMTGTVLSSTSSIHLVAPKDALDQIQSSFPQNLVLHEEVLSISHDKLADDLFTVPADYRKVLAPVHLPATNTKAAVASVFPSK